MKKKFNRLCCALILLCTFGIFTGCQQETNDHETNDHETTITTTISEKAHEKVQDMIEGAFNPLKPIKLSKEAYKKIEEVDNEPISEKAKKAIDEFIQIIDHNPVDAFPYLKLAELYQKTDFMSASIDILEKVAQANGLTQIDENIAKEVLCG